MATRGYWATIGCLRTPKDLLGRLLLHARGVQKVFCAELKQQSAGFAATSVRSLLVLPHAATNWFDLTCKRSQRSARLEADLDRDQIERFALWFALAALVLTGGATASWRLALVAAPLLVFCPPFRWCALALCVVALPSAAEILLHGDWIGSLGGRVRTAAGAVVLVCAAGFGARLRASRPLRQSFAVALPFLTVGLAAQALLRMFELVPPAWQYLSGNNLSALILVCFVPVLGLRIPEKSRRLLLGSLFVALLLSGSRWGIWTGCVFAFLMMASVTKRSVRATFLGVLGVSLILPWASWSKLDLNKGGFLRALAELAQYRPWTGVGPGGAEQLSLQFVERTSRLTHIESLMFDWASVWGWPIALGLLGSLVILAFWEGRQDPDETGNKLSWLAGVGLMGLLCHDLFDFALSSGALTVGMGMLIGLRLPSVGRHETSPLARLACGLLLSAALIGGHHFNPITMELDDRLESIPEQLGQRSFRYYVAQAQRAERPEDQISLYSKALAIAPGYRDAWFMLGDSMGRSGLPEQALLAYQRGLLAAKPNWTSPQTNAIARLPRDLIPQAIGQHLGAARSVVLARSRGDELDLKLVQAIDRQHRDPFIRMHYLRGLVRPEHDTHWVVPMLWQVILEPPIGSGDGVTALLEILRREPRASAPDLLLRMVRQHREHCIGVGAWPSTELVALAPAGKTLSELCGSVLIGRGADLRLLNRLNDVELQAP